MDWTNHNAFCFFGRFGGEIEILCVFLYYYGSISPCTKVSNAWNWGNYTPGKSSEYILILYWNENIKRGRHLFCELLAPVFLSGWRHSSTSWVSFRCFHLGLVMFINFIVFVILQHDVYMNSANDKLDKTRLNFIGNLFE